MSSIVARERVHVVWNRRAKPLPGIAPTDRVCAETRIVRPPGGGSTVMGNTANIDIRLLGGFAVCRAGEPISLAGRKTSALLAILALRPGTVLTRERLCDLLWSRSASEQARGSLRQALAQLRKALDDERGDMVESSADGLRLNPERVDVDAVRIEAALDDGTTEALENAAQCFTGELLQGFALDETPFDEWRRTAGQRLSRRALASFGALLEQHCAAGDVAAATALGERLLDIDPASEPTHQSLMRLHLDRGALGSAMAQYERCREALHAALGVPPSADTDALRRRIRAQPAPATQGAPSTPPLLAALPFANLSDDPQQGYFAVGFTEDVIRELSRFRGVQIMAAHSSFGAADVGGTPREIGERLGVRYLLTGSVRRTAALLRIGAELIDAGDGHVLWSHHYDLAPEAVLTAQDEIARGVATALAGRIDGERLKRAADKPLDSLEAYDCWLRGVAELHRATPESHARARSLFDRALEVDSGFARAHSGLSLTYFNEWSCSAWERWDEMQRKAFEHAQRGTQLDDSDPVTHFVLGRVLLYQREYERAEWHLDRAEALNPNDADNLAQLALSEALLGRPEHGIERTALAMRLNPFHEDWYFAFASMPHFYARNLEQSIEFGLKATDIATDVHAYLAAACAHLGRDDDARKHVQAFLEMFRRRISGGRDPRSGEALDWMMLVNPLRREADRAYLEDGLVKAGLGRT